MTTATKAGPSVSAALTLALAARIAAARDEVRTEEARRAARDELYRLESAATVTKSTTKARQEDIERLLRAIANADEVEPTEHARDFYGELHLAVRATFAHGQAVQHGRGRYGATAGKAPYASGTVWTGGDTVNVYQPKSGTNDPAKLATQYAEAAAAVRAKVAEYTAAAWLRAHGIDPAEAGDVRAFLRAETRVDYQGSISFAIYPTPGGKSDAWELATVRAYEVGLSSDGAGKDATPTERRAWAEQHAGLAVDHYAGQLRRITAEEADR